MVLKKDIEKLLGQKEQLLLDLSSKDLEIKKFSKKKTKLKKNVRARRKKNAKA